MNAITLDQIGLFFNVHSFETIEKTLYREGVEKLLNHQVVPIRELLEYKLHTGFEFEKMLQLLFSSTSMVTVGVAAHLIENSKNEISQTTIDCIVGNGYLTLLGTDYVQGTSIEIFSVARRIAKQLLFDPDLQELMEPKKQLFQTLGSKDAFVNASYNFYSQLLIKLADKTAHYVHLLDKPCDNQKRKERVEAVLRTCFQTSDYVLEVFQNQFEKDTKTAKIEYLQIVHMNYIQKSGNYLDFSRFVKKRMFDYIGRSLKILFALNKVSIS